MPPGFPQRASVACRCRRRWMTIAGSPPPLATVELRPLGAGTRLATITLASPPANTFDYASLQALDAAIDTVERADDVRGLVLRSAVRGFFSAGFDLKALYRTDRSRFEQLWGLGKKVFRRIYALPVHSVAAIDGHALGLGCVMAMACERRYMVHRAAPSPAIEAKPVALIGLNEAAVGMPVPGWLAVRFRDLTSVRAAERLLADGSVLSPSAAADVGLVDKLFDSPQAMEHAITAELDKSARVSAMAQQQTLSTLRREFLDRFDRVSAQDTADFWTAVSSRETQAGIGKALARLKSKPAK
ncbi:dodecenoyl-CoA isomerase [Coemansia sp. RSA 552]|nr:dodecenoyl-CoA isomerase [Coemansia sp. RSA 552]